MCKSGPSAERVIECNCVTSVGLRSERFKRSVKINYVKALRIL